MGEEKRLAESFNAYDRGYETAKLAAFVAVDKVKYDRFRKINGEVFVSVEDLVAVLKEI